MLEFKAVHFQPSNNQFNHCFSCKKISIAISPFYFAMRAQQQTWVLSRNPWKWVAHWSGCNMGLWVYTGTPGLATWNPGVKGQKSCTDGGPTDIECWLRWVCGGGKRRAGRKTIGRQYIPDEVRWMLPVVTLCLWHGGKTTGLVGPHYPISSEVSHWSRLCAAAAASFPLNLLSSPLRLRMIQHSVILWPTCTAYAEDGKTT